MKSGNRKEERRQAYFTFSQWCTKASFLVAVNLSPSKTTAGSP
jgi:hypothetical protein